MPMRPQAEAGIALAAAMLAASVTAVLAQSSETGENGGSKPIGLGETPREELVRAWNIDISPDGANLPEGSGSVAEGAEVYANNCVRCHGPDGTSTAFDQIAGGKGTLASENPVRTVGSYWPYATTLYDYIHRAMPFDDPQSLSPDQVYAVTAYVLNLNGLVPDDAVMDGQSLPEVEMPNQGSFEVMETRTLSETNACMEGCQPFDIETEAGASPETVEEEQVQ